MRRPPLATALLDSLREPGWARRLPREVLAGCVVGLVALPLSMALAIAIGLPPQHGLYTAVVAGTVAALLGGSRVQVTGPTAAFVVVLAPLVQSHGLSGLMVCSLGAGVLLLAMGMFRLGRLVEFIPNPVVAGFTLGIATVIGVLQIRDLLGLPGASVAGALPAMRALWQDAGLWRHGDALVGVTSLLALLIWPRLNRTVPNALVVLPLAAALGWWMRSWGPGWEVATIDSRFGGEVDGARVSGIPGTFPAFAWPWQQPGAAGTPPAWSMAEASTLVKWTFAIALLGAIESLLSAVIADGMTGEHHDPDSELMGQGLANMAAPFFGGFAATGALARTAVNVRAGARTPLASVVHALFLMAAMLVAAPCLGMLPMSAMAALLLTVARNMSDLKHCWFVVGRAPRGDAVTLVTCFVLTVAFDMVVAVGVGVVLASLLFMRRMAELSGVQAGAETPNPEPVAPHRGVLHYRVQGPLFFGAAQRAMNELQVRGNERVAVIDLTAVPMIDSTGLVNLQGAIERLRKAGLQVVLCGVQPAPGRVIERAEVLQPGVTAVASRDEAILLAEQLRDGAVSE